MPAKDYIDPKGYWGDPVATEGQSTAGTRPLY
jgi:hypothetical protein